VPCKHQAALTVQLCQVMTSEGALREEATHPAHMVDRLQWQQCQQQGGVNPGLHTDGKADACDLSVLRRALDCAANTQVGSLGCVT
jgi:hypothetical protein